MPLTMIRDDITHIRADAIVCPTDSTFSGSGGTDRAIRRAGGPALDAACRTLGRAAPGEARITPGFGLPCRYVIHTVGPVWHGGTSSETAVLSQCYRSALALALQAGCETVACPLLAAGSLGFPRETALQTAVQTISAFLSDCDLTVFLVVFDRDSFQISRSIYGDIAAYIDDRYAAAQPERRLFQRSKAVRHAESAAPHAPVLQSVPVCQAPGAGALRDALGQLDEGFSEFLLRKIAESGMTDAACYKTANIDRKLFSKIRNDQGYQPSKQTAIAFGLALELPLPELKELLARAGFALSHASKFDIIIEYFVSRGQYNVFEINEALFAFDQCLIGA